MTDKEYTYDIDKYTIGVDENGEDGIGMTVAKIENGEIYFLGNCYGENARCIDLLIKENQELKKQYEKVLNDYCRLDAYNKTQQKEFIKYLEDEIFKNTPTARWKHYDEDGSCDYTIENCNCVRIQPVNETLKETLQKYKSIIGVSDDKTN